MKKFIYGGLFLALVGLMIIGCNKEETAEAKATMKVSDYSKAGEIHNAFLTNVKENFEAVERGVNLEKRVEVINNFNKDFVSKLDLTDVEKQHLIQGLDDNKSLVVTSNLTKKCFSADNSKSVDGENLFTLIAKLKSDDLINENTQSILNRLSIDLKLNYESQLSDADLKQNVQELINEFDNLGYDVTSGEGEMVATILAVSIASIEWWEENPDAFADNTRGTNALPVWAAADIAGVVYGGATGAIASYAGTGEVNWTSVAVGAVSGAVAGSTGIVGKAGKWISSLF